MQRASLCLAEALTVMKTYFSLLSSQLAFWPPVGRNHFPAMSSHSPVLASLYKHFFSYKNTHLSLGIKEKLILSWALRKYMIRKMHFSNIGVYLVLGAEPFTKGCPGLWFPGPAQRGCWHAGKGVHVAARHSPPRRRISADPRCPAAQAGQHWHLRVRRVWPQHHTSAHGLLWEQHGKNVKLTSGACLLFSFQVKCFGVKTASLFTSVIATQTSVRLPQKHHLLVWMTLLESEDSEGWSAAWALILAFWGSVFKPKRQPLLPWTHLLEAWRTDEHSLPHFLRKHTSSNSLASDRHLLFSPVSTIRAFSSFCPWNEKPRLSRTW